MLNISPIYIKWLHPKLFTVGCETVTRMDGFTKNIKKTLKYILFFILFTLFFKLFGETSFRKWLKEDVLITKSVNNNEILPAPGITICPREVS